MTHSKILYIARLICLWAVLLWPMCSRAADFKAFHPSLEVFEDKSALISIEDIVAQPNKFPWRKVGENETSFGYSTSRFWLRMSLEEGRVSLGAGRGILVEIPYGYLYRVEFFGTSEGRVFLRGTAGLNVPGSTRNKVVLDTTYPVFLARHQELLEPNAEFYISAEGHNPISVPVNAYTAQSFSKHYTTRMLLLGTFFGMLAVVALQSGFLAISLRSRLFGSYALFVAFLSALAISQEGIWAQHFWANFPWWKIREAHVYGGFTLIFYSYFALEFLGRKKCTGWLERLLVLFVGISTLRSIWILFSDSLIVAEIGQIAIGLSNILLLLIGIAELRRGSRIAKYFVAASAAFDLALVLFFLQNSNLIHVSSYLNLAPYFGAVLEVLFLGMALIDQVRLANRELAAQRLEILHTEKLRALGRMAGEIAHEINNPLAIIHGNSVLMKSILQSGGDSTQLPQLAASVEQTAMRISRIVKGMKRVARDSRHDPMKETPFSSILQDTYALCEERVRGRTLELKFPEIGDDLILKCRSSEICQVLLNLVGNALDAVEGQDSPKIAVDATLRGSNLEIGVTDSGPGIPKELRARILEPFFTTKESGKGMGLGLSISRAIIEGHGGSLWLDDSSQDTRFVFTLPVSS